MSRGVRFIRNNTSWRGRLFIGSLRSSASGAIAGYLRTYVQDLPGGLGLGCNWAPTGSGWLLESVRKSSKWPRNRQKSKKTYFPYCFSRSVDNKEKLARWRPCGQSKAQNRFFRIWCQPVLEKLATQSVKIHHAYYSVHQSHWYIATIIAGYTIRDNLIAELIPTIYSYTRNEWTKHIQPWKLLPKPKGLRTWLLASRDAAIQGVNRHYYWLCGRIFLVWAHRLHWVGNAESNKYRNSKKDCRLNEIELHHFHQQPRK